ncbi:MAG: DUF86 domain-containing protein [Candidatus Lokiarchaeota archaeon]|nr:DUF86 domain-containing protein [Candidatus Lokiarchaeota archaeon]
MVDKQTIMKRISMIERCLLVLEKTKEKELKVYINDFREQLASERALQIAIEACIDIGTHIISARKFRRPTDYADVFMILHEENVLSSEITEKLTKMARFRNRLVHAYLSLDQEVVFSIINENLDDFRMFLSEIALLFAT